jgi:beta-lactamase regulating signal transducer with metallopeptidase domain
MMQQAFIEYIVNALWQIPLLAGGAWLLLRIVRPRPQLQHGVWLAVLGLAVLLPMHGMVKPMRIQAGDLSPDIAPVHDAAIAPERAPQMYRLRLGETSAHWLARLYLATFVFGLFRIVQSWLAARQLLAGSREVRLGEENKRAFERYGQRLNIALPQIRESDEITSPMILGVMHPVLLLPEDFAQFSASEVRAALCHELAHVKRRDFLGNLLCQVVALPVAWHPFMMAIQQRIRMTREMVCDAMAAREIDSSLGYAKSLLALARGLLGDLEIAGRAEFPGLFGNNRLEERVTRLMDTSTISVRTKLTRVLSGAMVTVATLSAAAIFHVTPMTAASQQALPPQLAQSAPAVTEAEPADAAPEPPIVPEEPSRTRSGNREPGADARLREREWREQAEEMRQDAQRMKAEFDSPAFKRQIEEAQRQALQGQPAMDSAKLKSQLDEAMQSASHAQIEMNSDEMKRRIDEAMQQASRAQIGIDSAEIKRQVDEAQRQMSDGLMMKREFADAARRFAEAARELDESREKGQSH